MMHALIIGIEKYDQLDWDIEGPCANALAVAEWLISTRVVEGANVFLFLDAIADYDQRIRDLRAQGVDAIQTSATWTIIEDFCFKQLPAGRPADSRLFIYWSGHGYAENSTGQRYFICRDYTNTALHNRVFNASLFLRHLRSPEFQRFSETLLLADVCGAKQNVKLSNPRGGPENVDPRKQLAYFATPEGQWAHGEEGRGAFTDIVLVALKHAKPWPDLDNFRTMLDDELSKAGHAMFRVVCSDGTQDLADRIIGPVKRESVIDKLVELLRSKPVDTGRYQFHYARTVTNLGNPRLNEAQGLTGMLEHLAGLCDLHGLLEFLLRLAQEKELKHAIEDWLTANAAHQASDIATIRDEIDEENQAHILVLDLENSPDGDIAAFEPHLRTQNLEPLPDPRLARQNVKDWNDFEQGLRNLLKQLGPDSVSQIWFLANPPLFDRGFHLIPAPDDGSPLGDKFVVLIRHRERIRSAKRHIRDAWEQYAAALRASEPAKLPIIPLPSIGSQGLIGTHRGVCYFNILMPLARQGVPCSLNEKALMLKLLRLGVPYMCWVHLPAPVNWADLEAFLSKNCLSALHALDRFPDTFTQHRISSIPYAAQASLLWDDPLMNPF
jgi:vWA-MoxR associated protein C-terminal domain/Caspase domain